MNIPRRILFTGCSGGGKSTLLDALAAADYRVFPEPGREIVKDQLAGDGSALPWVNEEKFAKLALARSVENFQAAPNGTVFFDRSFIDALAGLERLGCTVSQQFADTVDQCRFHTVFLFPPWPELFSADQERKLSFGHALEEFNHLELYLSKAGYRPILMPKVSVQERIAFVRAAIAEETR